MSDIKKCFNLLLLYSILITQYFYIQTRVLILSADQPNSGLAPREETLQPIIAAWALCGNERSTARVAEWINQLAALSATMPMLTPDLNMFTAKVIANRRYQASVIKRCFAKAIESTETKEQDAPEAVKLTFELAQRCCELLVDDLLSDKTNLAGLMDANACAPIFTNCIEAWGEAACLAKQLRINEYGLNLNHGVREMINICRHFESKVGMTLKLNQDGEKSNRHIIECIGDIFTAVVHQLSQLDTTSPLQLSESDDPPGSIVGERIPDVERMLRSYEQYTRLLNGSSDLDMKAKRLEFYGVILRGLRGVNATSDYGHVVRLCCVVMDYLSYSRECRDEEFTLGGDDMTDLYTEMVSLISNCTVNPRERKLLLTKVFNKASPFFDQLEDKKKQFGIVDKSKLIGAIRLALGGDAESFLEDLEKRQSQPGRRKEW